MNWVQVLIGLAVLAWLVYWFRGYGPTMRRAYQTARNLWRVGAQIRGATRARPGPAPARGGRVVDVSAKKPALTVCPACGDRLNAAQVDALRGQSVRCPGSSRVGRPCPFREDRVLN